MRNTLCLYASFPNVNFYSSAENVGERFLFGNIRSYINYRDCYRGLPATKLVSQLLLLRVVERTKLKLRPYVLTCYAQTWS